MIDKIREFLLPEDFLVLADLQGTRRSEQAVDLLIELPQRVVQLGDIFGVRMPNCSNIFALKQMMRLQRAKRSTIFICGNHEQMFIDSCRYGGPPVPTKFDDPEIIEGYEEIYREFGHIPAEFRAFICNAKLFHEGQHVIFLHAGYELDRVGTLPEHIPVNQYLWAYEVNSKWRGKKLVHGHRLTDGAPVEHSNHINCETGGWIPERPLCISIITDSASSQKLRGWIELYPESIKLVVAT